MPFSAAEWNFEGRLQIIPGDNISRTRRGLSDLTSSYTECRSVDLKKIKLDFFDWPQYKLGFNQGLECSNA